MTELKTIIKAYNKDMQEEDMHYLPHFNGKIQEIRDMGYDFIGALLELTDNSARKNCESSNIDIILHDDNNLLSRTTVCDNGIGMSFNELRQAFIYNFLKKRIHGDIGKYHVGMKYASIVIGDHITILSRQPNRTISGIHLDVNQMYECNTFTPTDVRENVDDAWALKYVHPNDYEKFKQQTSGTLVSIKNLTPMCKQNIEKVKNELIKVLPFSYSMLYNDCKVNLYENSTKIQTIEPYDLFYHNSPDCLDEPAYETIIHVYKNINGHRIIEINRNKRKMNNKKKESESYTKGTTDKPVYYEFTQYGKRCANNMTQIKTLPDIDTLVAVIHLHLIQVNHNTFSLEREIFVQGSRLQIDRKGVFFLRENRNVSETHQLGHKISDRTTMAVERQRCLVTFKSEADKLVGSQFNKTIDTKHKLPCIELNDGIHAIYKQVTSDWTKKHPGKKKEESDSDDSDSEEEPTTPTTPTTPVTPVTPILPVINDSSNSSDNETDSDESDISSIEYPIINDVHHTPIYSNKLENGNIIFMEDGQPCGTLYSPENMKGLQSWLNGMSQEGHKKYSYILLQSQNF
jgi:hypothetical protein